MFKDFRTLLTIKRYSPNTIEAYIGLLYSFSGFIGYQIKFHSFNQEQLKKKISAFILHKKYAYTTQKQLLSAIKLYLKEIHNEAVDFNSLSPRRPQRVLPEIFSKVEIKRLLDTTKNKKHKAMLATVYSLGLRSGELVGLKISHLDKHRNTVYIKSAKGNKDRMLPYPESLRVILRAYYMEYKPKEFLFEGQKGGAYTSSSLRAVFNNSCKRAYIKKKVTCHNLRHSYATHLLEGGTNLKVIQELLGHNSIKTTMLYTQVSTRSILNVKSPLDGIEINA